MAIRLPRSNGVDPVVIDASLWDRIAPQLERLSNFTAAAPLYLNETSSGFALALQGQDLSEVLWGTVDGGDYTTGATITLMPVTIDLVLKGLPTDEVYVKKDRSSYTMANGTSVTVGTPVPYCVGSDGKFYILGHDPKTIPASATTWNSTLGVFECIYFDTWGTFHGTDSDPIEVPGDFTDCPDEEEPDGGDA